MSSPPRATRFPSSDSFEFVSPHVEGNSLFDDSDDGNDIVLSPRRLASSQSSPSLAVEDQDFVLVLPGSSLLGSPTLRAEISDDTGSEGRGHRISGRQQNGIGNGEEDDSESNSTSDDDDDDDSVISAFNSLRLSTPRHRTRAPPLTDTESEPDTARALTPNLRPHHISSSSLHFPASSLLTTSVPQPSVHPPLTKSQKRNKQRARAKVRKALASIELGNANGVLMAPAPSLSKGARRRQRQQAKAATTNGAQAISTTTVIDEENMELYDNAVKFMTASLESPSKILDKHDRLALCQALLIELGVTTTEASIPRSHRAAKALLQSTVHINIVDYLAVRKQGLVALRKVMHPSKKSLRASLQKKRAPLSKVKSSGLHALLVSH